MAQNFDPYLQWLGIRDPQRPPNYYRLLGVEPFESDPVVLTNAVDRQMAHVRNFQAGQHSAASQRILNELAAAKLCLLHADRKAAYDAQLQAQQAAALQTPSAGPGLQTGAGRGENPAPAGLWPSAPRPVAGPQPAQAAPQGDSNPLLGEDFSTTPQPARAEPAARLFSIAITVLVAMILVLLGLIVVISTSGRRGAPEGPVVGPWLEEPTPPPPGGDGEPGTKPETKPHAKPEVTPESNPKVGPDVKPETKPPIKPETKPPIKPETKPPLPPTVDESIQAARAAMARRDPDSARSHLDLARQAADPDSDQAKEIERLQAVLGYLDGFHKALRAGMRDLRPGQQLAAGRFSAAVVAVDGDSVVLRLGGQEEPFTAQDLPVGLALAIGGRMLPGGQPGSSLSEAAALTFDPSGDLDQAERLCRDAAQQGLPAAELLEELKLARARRGLPPRFVKLSVPDQAAQDQLLREIKEVFQREYREYAEAQTPEAKRKLGETLLSQGMDTKDSPAARYVLLVEAKDLAAEAGAADVLRRALERLDRWYDVNLAQMASRTMTEAAKRGRPPAANKAMAQAALELAKTARSRDEFGPAAELAEAAIAMARKAGDSTTLKQAVADKRDIEELRHRYDLFVKAGEALAQDPDNAAANLVRGSYLCFVKDDWTEGLPMLLKGNDSTLRALAEAELAEAARAPEKPVPADLVVLGDEWWDAAEAAPDDLTRGQYRGRAAYWYELAKPGLTGLTWTKVDRRLKEVNPP